jgi:hypothetical protein
MSNSTVQNSRNKPGKKPGSEKTGGRKAGTPNKRTCWLKSVLEENDFDWGKDFSLSMRCSDYERVKILIELLPYLNPKVNPQSLDDESSESNDININLNLSSLLNEQS